MRNNRYSFLLLFFLLVAFAGNAQNNSAFKINQITVVPDTDPAKWFAQNVGTKSDFQLVLLKCEAIFSDAEKKQLLEKGILLQEYLGQKVYAARIDKNSNLDVTPNIKGISSFLPEYKIANTILEKSSVQKKVDLFVSFYDDITPGQITVLCSKHQAVVLPNSWQKNRYYKIQIPSVQLKLFASFYGVKFISEPLKSVALDIDGKSGEGAAVLNMPSYLGGKGLLGKGVTIGHGDDCSGIYHIDQNDRVVNNNNGNIASHGVLVNGIMGGDGIMDPAGQGIATDSRFISYYFDAVILLKSEIFKGYNATITNNSYRADRTDLCSYSGVYDLLSQNLDEMAFKVPEQLDVFAAGNDGTGVCGGYPAGYFNVSGGFQTAKNILTVGSCFRDHVVSSTSSRGPLKDGRLKPEIMAVGANIYCPVPNNSYTFTSGTSLACPQVVGILSLLSERYKQLHANANPKSDLLKAIAINGASDLGRPGPDFWYGFGMVNGARSLDILENNHYARNTISSGTAPQTRAITVPPQTAQLKVLLYYHDPVASAASATQLINDLDLRVVEPGGTIHRPLILDPSVSGAGNNAVEGADHLNNVEQVTINNPAAGSYTISVSDFSIPSGPQDYVLVYDFIPNDIKLLFPLANTSAPANTDMYIYWDAPADVTTTKVEYSINNGASWTTIEAAVPANVRFYKWAVPAINSNQCKVRLTNGSKITESGPFIIHEQSVVTLNPVQCPGSVAVSWTNVPVADKYYVLLKKGAHFEKADSVSGGTLSYTFTGLKTSEEYYVSVQPAIGGMDGYRSKAVTRKPNTGSCAVAANGDLSLEKIVLPLSGRRFTSSALKTNSQISVLVRNQDDDAVASYGVYYKINSGLWRTTSVFSIAANTTVEHVIDIADFSDTIDYTITVAVYNNDRVDPVRSNDTLVKTIKHIANNPVSLLSTLSNDFESLPDFTLLNDTVGLSDDGFWDFENSTDTGRLRSAIPGSNLVKTNRSVSMDVNMNNSRTLNYFTGTFNLSGYDTTADEVRFDFDYEMRGMPVLKDSNKVWVRGDDLAVWIPAFTYSNDVDTAKMHNSGTISLRDLLRYNKQNFSSSTQIRFGQFDSTLIVNDAYGGGLTIDNVHLYKVSKDVQLVSIVQPQSSNCDITESQVMIKLKNGTSTPMAGINVAYTIDGSAPISEFIPTLIAGNDSLVFTFAKSITGLTFGAHTLKVWLHIAGDDYLKNDTIDNFVFYNSPTINNFPYLENFETSNGNWYATGRNLSWEWGVPAAEKVKQAASGQKIWKTNLKGKYNNNEQSYLVSPCINTMGLTNPMLSFSLIFDVEHCDDKICDAAYLEYSTDNEQSWVKILSGSTGTNWYNDIKNDIWGGTDTRWHVASASLPKASQLKIRFVMSTDIGSNQEGLAIDDIHVYDLENKIATVDGDAAIKSAEIPVNATTFQYFMNSGKIIAGINPQGENKGLLSASLYGHTTSVDPVKRQYSARRNWAVHRDLAAASKSLLRLYITDIEVQDLLKDTSCKTCSRAEDIYRTGVTQYQSANRNTEDSSLRNNLKEGYRFLPYTAIKWVPYDNGYYAELESDSLGEYWLNDGGILGTLPLNTEYVVLSAAKINNSEAQLSWTSNIDTQMNKYEVQRSFDSVNFSSLNEVSALKKYPAHYAQPDKPSPEENAAVYYRLYCTAQNGKTFYSNTASVAWTKGDELVNVYPVPSGDGKLNIIWTGAVGSVAQYSFTDVAGKTILQGQIKSEKWTNNTNLNLDFLSKGIYYFKFYIGSNDFVKQVIFK